MTIMSTMPAYRQNGQALTEATIVLGALAGLLWAVFATGTWQDDALRTGLAARQAAFAYSRLGDDRLGNDRLGDDSPVDSFLPDVASGFNGGDADILITFAAIAPDGLPDSAQPGGAHAHAATLRRDWRVADAAVMAAQANVAASQRGLMGATLGAELGGVQAFTRHTVVLRGAGHAGDDAQTHARIAASDLGWQTPAQASRAAGQALAARMQPVDAPWLRPHPDFDWLQKWTAVVPPQALQAGAP